MPDLLIDTNGILKLLANLKTDKASGLDDIKPVVFKEHEWDFSCCPGYIWEVFGNRPTPKRLDKCKSESSFQKRW